jgi:hypothetical protein
MTRSKISGKWSEFSVKISTFRWYRFQNSRTKRDSGLKFGMVIVLGKLEDLVGCFLSGSVQKLRHFANLNFRTPCFFFWKVKDDYGAPKTSIFPAKFNRKIARPTRSNNLQNCEKCGVTHDLQFCHSTKNQIQPTI